MLWRIAADQEPSSAGVGSGRRRRALRDFAPATPLRRDLWHADCFVTGMIDENYFLMLLQVACLLMFSCGVVVLAQHPEWFGV
jgi:hypothetical protein